MATLGVFSRAHANANKLIDAAASQAFKAHMAAPEGKSMGIVFIMHDWDGLN